VLDAVEGENDFPDLGEGHSRVDGELVGQEPAARILSRETAVPIAGTGHFVALLAKERSADLRGRSQTAVTRLDLHEETTGRLP
jgi:hypothetical protein